MSGIDFSTIDGLQDIENSFKIDWKLFGEFKKHDWCFLGMGGFLWFQEGKKKNWTWSPPVDVRRWWNWIHSDEVGWCINLATWRQKRPRYVLFPFVEGDYVVQLHFLEGLLSLVLCKEWLPTLSKSWHWAPSWLSTALPSIGRLFVSELTCWPRENEVVVVTAWKTVCKWQIVFYYFIIQFLVVTRLRFLRLPNGHDSHTKHRDVRVRDSFFLFSSFYSSLLLLLASPFLVVLLHPSYENKWLTCWHQLKVQVLGHDFVTIGQPCIGLYGLLM